MIFYSADVCGRVLFELNVPEADVKAAKKTFLDCPELSDVLNNPTIKKEERFRCIDKLFPKSLSNFLKVMTEAEHMNEINQIFEAYENHVLDSKNILRAQLYYITKPDDSVINQFKETLKKKYDVSDVLLDTISDNSLIGGYRLVVNGVEFDKSILGTVKSLQNTLTRR